MQIFKSTSGQLPTDVRVLKPIKGLRVAVNFATAAVAKIRVQFVGQNGSSVDVIPLSPIQEILSLSNYAAGAYRSDMAAVAAYGPSQCSQKYLEGYIHLGTMASKLDDKNFLQITISSSGTPAATDTVIIDGIEGANIARKFIKFNKLAVPAAVPTATFDLSRAFAVGLPVSESVSYIINYNNGVSRNITASELAAIGQKQSDTAVNVSTLAGGAVSKTFYGQYPVVTLPCKERNFEGDVQPAMTGIVVNVDASALSTGYNFYALQEVAF